MASGLAALVQSPLGDLVISQGADNTYAYRYGIDDGETVTWVDLTGWDARAQIRSRPGAEIWLSLGVDPAEASRIILDAQGYVTIHLDHTTTEAPEWNSPARAQGVWDLELVNPGGEVIRLVMGAVLVSADVTRDD